MNLRWFLDLDVARSIGGPASTVVDRALHGVTAGLQAGGIKLHVRAGAGDLPACGCVAIGQRIVVRIFSIAGDSGALTGEDGAALDEKAGGRRVVGPFLDLNIGGAGSR